MTARRMPGPGHKDNTRFVFNNTVTAIYVPLNPLMRISSYWFKDVKTPSSKSITSKRSWKLHESKAKSKTEKNNFKRS